MKHQAILMGIMLIAAMLGVSSADDKELLKAYKGDVVLPQELYQTYTNLVAALETGSQKEIEKFCLVDKIKFTSNPREKGREDYGQDINLPFLKNGFDKTILNLRRDSDTEYLIRTGSTALWFTRTPDGKWKLSKYLDKPIE